jgi:hypothetical protein
MIDRRHRPFAGEDAGRRRRGYSSPARGVIRYMKRLSVKPIFEDQP